MAVGNWYVRTSACTYVPLPPAKPLHIFPCQTKERYRIRMLVHPLGRGTCADRLQRHFTWPGIGHSALALAGLTRLRISAEMPGFPSGAGVPPRWMSLADGSKSTFREERKPRQVAISSLPGLCCNTSLRPRHDFRRQRELVQGLCQDLAAALSAGSRSRSSGDAPEDTSKMARFFDGTPGRRSPGPRAPLRRELPCRPSVPEEMKAQARTLGFTRRPLGAGP